MASVGQNILGARKRAALTQAELAHRCGIAQPNIAAFERGARQPSLAGLRQIALGLNLTAEDLLKGPGGADQFTRFDFEAFGQDLVRDRPNEKLDKSVWRDLQAVFFPKLRALYPGKRRKPRISAGAALLRLKALYGQDFVVRLNGRFAKLNMGLS